MINVNPTETIAWRKLRQHFESSTPINLKDLFKENANRAQQFTVKDKDFLVDFSKNLLTQETLDLLLELAAACKLEHHINAYFSGDKINITEQRPVMHTALRTPLNKATVNTQPCVTAALDSKKAMYSYVDKIHNGSIKTSSGERFTHVVNIGIGGSDLGPVMVYESLQAYKNNLELHFISNVDGDHVQEVLKKIDPARTLFVVVSKSFSTQETLTNATTVRNWFTSEVSKDAVDKHFIAVSSNVDKAVDFGIARENIFPMFDWVGGRFSLWSTVGMAVALGIGTKNFQGILDGAHQMDEHFASTPHDKNIPVLLALITIWYNNFYQAQTEAIIPYSQYLYRLPAYLQQAIMESNGKNVDRDGNSIAYQTGTIIWGEPGTNSQHAFFQLIHQGTKLIPATFIAFAKAKYHNSQHQDKLISNYIAQTEALMNGKSLDQVNKELKASGKSNAKIDQLAPFKVFKGNKPTTSILIDELTPQSIGKLIAMYEHKIFTEGVLWNIYSYDQWGVELGKQLGERVLQDIENASAGTHDASTTQLLEHYFKTNSTN